MNLQSHENPHFKNFGTPNLGVTKWHLGVGFITKHKEYYKGERGGLPQVRAMVSLMNLCLTMAPLCTNSAPIMH
jgi:hypothetical protein